MKPFLTADWKNLVFANYTVDPVVLRPYLPMGTEIDFFEGKCFVSLVGFMFLNTAVKGIRYPFHTNFEEFNLRFYVRFPDGNGWKRGVVFVREIVPRRMITQVARLLYGERYYYHPMKNSLVITDTAIDVKYEFLFRKEWNHIAVTAAKEGKDIVPGSETEFITEHYWGYTKRGPALTSEYNVQHPSWKVHEVTGYSVGCDTLHLYGEELHRFLDREPSSVFMAAGSPVSVHQRVMHRY